jgi:hypothetical protein
MRNAYKILVAELEGKTPLGRPRSRWEDNFKTGLWEIGFGGVVWIHMAQDRGMTRSYEHGKEHYGSIKGREFLD